MRISAAAGSLHAGITKEAGWVVVLTRQGHIVTSIRIGWRWVPSIAHQRRCWIAERWKHERNRVVDLTRQDHIVTSIQVGRRRVPSIAHQRRCWIAERWNHERSRVEDLTRQAHIVTSIQVGWRWVPSIAHQHRQADVMLDEIQANISKIKDSVFNLSGRVAGFDH